jgi:hypothetical protein
MDLWEMHEMADINVQTMREQEKDISSVLTVPRTAQSAASRLGNTLSTFGGLLDHNLA